MTNVLTVNDVTLEFAGVRALDSVSFSVDDQELFAIIGPNGAGKTSIFNVLSGVYQPRAGSVHFAGTEITAMDPHEIAGAGMARTFQNIELFGNLDLIDNLMLGRHRHLHYSWWRSTCWSEKVRTSESSSREVVEEIIEFLKLEHYRNKPVRLLPYGIQKRIELGRALAMEPALLLLDEPVAGMNVEETEDTARYILDVRQELGIPIVLVEHDMALVMEIADRVLALDFGRPLTVDVPEAVRSHPEVVRSYIGGHQAPGAIGTPTRTAGEATR